MEATQRLLHVGERNAGACVKEQGGVPSLCRLLLDALPLTFISLSFSPLLAHSAFLVTQSVRGALDVDVEGTWSPFFFFFFFFCILFCFFFFFFFFFFLRLTTHQLFRRGLTRWILARPVPQPLQ